MKAFSCRVCANALFFENSVCMSCQTRQAYARTERAIVPVDETGKYVDAAGLESWVCSSLLLSGCTWLTERQGGQCFACSLTRTRPNNADAVGLANYVSAERAKRHLIVELDDLNIGLVPKSADPENGLTFDMLSGVNGKVVMGHDHGVITIDVAESDPAHREKVRVTLDEPYRTMLGHFRHEIGHYFQWRYVRGGLIEECRRVFGDETRSYQDAIDRHYRDGPPEDWAQQYISTYATMHPYEDFAETFAHFLHIRDTIDTATEQGLMVVDQRGFSSFRDLVGAAWIPLSTALNQINRSMGRDDLYPFVIPAVVVDKLAFVASLVGRRSSGTTFSGSPSASSSERRHVGLG